MKKPYLVSTAPKPTDRLPTPQTAIFHPNRHLNPTAPAFLLVNHAYGVDLPLLKRKTFVFLFSSRLWREERSGALLTKRTIALGD